MVVGTEAFKNVVEQGVALNCKVPLWTVGANVNCNVLGGVLVEYNDDKTPHEVWVDP